MIDIYSTERLKNFLPKIKSFVEDELLPIENHLLTTSFYELSPLLEEKRKIAKQLGIWAPYLPEREGGSGLSLTEFAQVSEVLAWTLYGHYCLNCQAPDVGNIELLSDHGTEEQKEKYLKPLINGDIRSCFSMTEPENAGSNPVILDTKAEKSEDNYIINGRKWFTTGADGASFAIVMAVTDPDAGNYQKASMIIVPTDNPGFKRVRNTPIMGEPGEGHDSHSEIKYDNCKVPVENIIGKEGEGFYLAQQRLGPGRVHHCMRWIGTAERALDMMCQRASSRSLGGDTLLAHKQTVQNWIAESRASIDACRLMVLNTAHMLETVGSKNARNEISAIKFYVANMLQEVLDRAIQVHGAYGLTDDCILSHWYRHERAARIYDGPDEVHKSSLARQILKNYGVNKK
ncbi:acyl-CoA dehydrogenase family protein [Mangrovivirga sp. M17]|uniref:Acyl-CoA dehydrogenase family protein n=1 Tax=Mangrovivirga halotolerans TaxID=2993936 RepID=A0ABT3RMN2_9BACT|nr:acyl-CoA dehydrogenase family protein [Mangrovivirga halotolerans]MCX2743072.1 acyl-CoA dehydrogenase family protein [Mangrovivirga halotolerans]